MIELYYRRPRFWRRLPTVIRRLILIAASLLIAYHVLSTLLTNHATAEQREESEQSHP